MRSSKRGSPGVIAPISFRTVEENSRANRATFGRTWARTYAKKLAESESSPLFGGRWVSSCDDGRVHAWRKHARAGTLPPVTLYWISGLCAHVVLDGHDRALAASLENVPAPVLYLDAVQERRADEKEKEVILEAVAQAFARAESNTEEGRISPPLSSGRPLTVENANRLLLVAFAPQLASRLTRTAVLSGGVASWSREVSDELTLQKRGDSTLLDDLRGESSGA